MSAVFFVIGGEMMGNMLGKLARFNDWGGAYGFFKLKGDNTTKKIIEKKEGQLKEKMNASYSTVSNQKNNPIDTLRKRLEGKIKILENFEENMADADYSKLADNDKVKYWTEKYFGVDQLENENYSIETCIKIILLSKEFAAYCIDKRGDSISMYRHRFMGVSQREQLNEQETIKKMEDFFNSKNSSSFDDQLQRMLNNLYTALFEGISIDKNSLEDLGRIDVLKTEISNISESKKKTSSLYKDAIKDIIQNRIKSMIEKSGKNQLFDKIDFKYTFQEESGKNFFYIAVGVQEHPSPLRKDIEKDPSSNKVKTKYAEILAKGITKYCDSIKNDTLDLDLGFYGIISSGVVKSIVSKIIKNTTEVKSFFNDRFKKEALSPQYFSNEFQGTLAEIAAIEREEERKGNTQDFIEINGEKKKLGQSFRDVQKENNKNGKIYGYNLKHYISQDFKETFPLYSKEEPVGIFAKEAYRYYDAETLLALRYIAANKLFFDNMSIESSIKGKVGEKTFPEAISKISAINSDYFLRQDSPELAKIAMSDRNDLGNVFYILNNLVIPTSIIFQQLLAQLNNNNYIKDTFSVTGSFVPVNELNPKLLRGKNGKEQYRMRNLVWPTTKILTSKNNFQVKFSGFKVDVSKLKF